MKRGQVAMEVIFIIALVLIVTIPFLAVSMSNLNKKFNDENEVQKVTEIANGIETIANLGPGNSMTVVTSKGFKIINNELFFGDPAEGEQISVTLIPQVKDADVDEGEIKIINDNDEGLVIAEIPKINSLNPTFIEAPKNVNIIGNNFIPDGRVFFNDRDTNSYIYVSETKIKSWIDPKQLQGSYPIRVESYVGDEVLVSNTVYIETGIFQV